MSTFKAKIKDIEKIRHQATGKDFLDLTVEVIEVADEGEETIVSTQKHALNPAITKEELVEVVEKIRAGWELEQKQKKDNEAENAINENVDLLKKELTTSEVVNGEIIEKKSNE